MNNLKLRNYFERSYPVRKSRLSKLIYRKGEEERLNHIKKLLVNCQGKEILDAGCGDGVFLSKALSDRPLLIRLEDIALKKVIEAKNKLVSKADKIEAIVNDCNCYIDDKRFDIVLVIGVFDYENNWQKLLNAMLKRTKGILVFDFPNRRTLHYFLRKIWLWTKGISLNSIPIKALDGYMNDHDLISETIKLTFNCLVKIEKQKIQ